MKIAITGGHFAPALAVIEKLKDEEILVIGRKSSHEGDSGESFEYKTCKELHIPFKTIRTGRLQRVVTPQTIPALAKFPIGVFEALKLLKNEKPDVVVTFGGYIALPVAIAARILSIPIVLHEQVLGAGMTSRIIDKLADVVCISFESSRKNFKNKNIVLTGNPIREGLLDSSQAITKSPRQIIFITGGSSGSHSINMEIKEILTTLLNDFTVIHQTGSNTLFNDLQVLREYRNLLPENLKEHYILKPFFDTKEFGWLLKNASLVISRSGINIVTELLAFGTLALLVPLPYGQKNEQLENAKYSKKIGLGEYILQKDLYPQLLLSTIHAMIKKQSEYRKNASKEEMTASLNATNRIIEEIYKYGGSKGRETRKSPQET